MTSNMYLSQAIPREEHPTTLHQAARVIPIPESVMLELAAGRDKVVRVSRGEGGGDVGSWDRIGTGASGWWTARWGL